MLMHVTVLADVSSRIAELFLDLPMLTGFSVQDRASLSEDRNHAPSPASSASPTCRRSLARFQAGPRYAMRLDRHYWKLLDQHPESYDALRGQTFARTLH